MSAGGAGWDDGSVAAAATAALPDGSEEPWIALPPTGPVRLLVPRGTPEAALPALRQLLGHGSAMRRAGVELGSRALALGAGALVPRRPQWSVAANRLADLARRVAGLPHAVGVIRLNPGRPNRKPVVQLLHADLGSVAAYAKIGWDELAADLVRHEADVLEQLHPPTGLVVPDLLGRADRPMPVVAVAPIAAATAPTPRTSTAELAATSLRLFAPSPDRQAVPLATAGFVTALRDRLSRVLDVRPDADGAAVTSVHLDRVLDRLGHVEVTTGRWHGDFNPANVVVIDDTVGAWDWERSTADAPHGLDAAYALLTDLDAGAAVAALVDLGLPHERAEALVAVALAATSVRYVEAAVHGVPTASNRVAARLEQWVAR